MGDQTVSQETGSVQKLKIWIESWAGVRSELEALIIAHSERDPALHFELTLATIELKDIDDAVRRAAALGRLLHVGDVTSAELEATGNR